MGYDEIFVVGYVCFESGEQFGWCEFLMFFVQIILIDKIGFYLSMCLFDVMFCLVVEWVGSWIKCMQLLYCISYDGYFFGRSKVG